jgi:hypothetical protein
MTASIHETDTIPVRHARSPMTRDAGVTDLDQVRATRAACAQERRRAARSRDLTALLHNRPDLTGVHAPADFAVDAVRWGV